jgi:predicted porin
MRPLLPTVAVAAALWPLGAAAEVSLAGEINVGVEFLSVGNASAAARDARLLRPALGNDGKGLSSFGVNNNYSNLTVSSLEELGGGVKLDFAFRVQMTNDAAGGELTNHDSHIGFTSERWGGAWYGTNEDVYERYLYSIDPLDEQAGLGGNLQIMGTPGGNVFTVYNATTGPDAFTWNRREGNVVWYDSPNLGGFTFGLAWQTNDDRSGRGLSPRMFQAGVRYEASAIPLQLWSAYGRRKDQLGLVGFARQGYGIEQTAGGSDDRALQFGAAYGLGPVTVFAVWERLDYRLDDAGYTGTLSDSTLFARWKRDALALGFKWNVPTGYWGAQYVQALDARCQLGAAYAAAAGTGTSCQNVAGSGFDTGQTGARMIGAGYYHTLSKQTQVYLVASWIDNEAFATYGGAGISNAANFNAGATIWGVGAGLVYTF